MVLADADFMIHGVFKYTLFGQELYITTTHVAMFIVTVLMLIVMICAHHKMKHAEQIPGQYGYHHYGQECETFCELHLYGIYVYTVLQLVGSSGASPADSRLRCYITARSYNLCTGAGVRYCQKQREAFYESG